MWSELFFIKVWLHRFITGAVSAGKFYPMINYLPNMPRRCIETWTYSSTIFCLSTIWKWVVSFTHRPLYARGKACGTHWIGGCKSPRAALKLWSWGKSLSLAANRTPAVQPLARRCINRAIEAHYITAVEEYTSEHSVTMASWQNTKKNLSI
jgi:hypothetical protein